MRRSSHSISETESEGLLRQRDILLTARETKVTAACHEIARGQIGRLVQGIQIKGWRGGAGEDQAEGVLVQGRGIQQFGEGHETLTKWRGVRRGGGEGKGRERWKQISPRGRIFVQNSEVRGEVGIDEPVIRRWRPRGQGGRVTPLSLFSPRLSLLFCQQLYPRRELREDVRDLSAPLSVPRGMLLIAGETGKKLEEVLMQKVQEEARGEFASSLGALHEERVVGEVAILTHTLEEMERVVGAEQRIVSRGREGDSGGDCLVREMTDQMLGTVLVRLREQRVRVETRVRRGSVSVSGGGGRLREQRIDSRSFGGVSLDSNAVLITLC
jgi:hypothetical protein